MENTTQVPFVNPRLVYGRLRDYLDKAFKDVMSRGDFILRKDVDEFEKNVAEFLGVKYVVGVNSGTDALVLSLKAAGIKAGDEVICSSHTFWATLEAIYHNGATPVLVDTDNDLLMKEEDIESKITDKTKAILPVHLAGAMCDMTMIMDIATRHNLVVIEDAAQAFGAKQSGISAGTFGLTGCFSFYPFKVLGAYGDAGAVVTNDENIYKLIRNLRNHNMVKHDGAMETTEVGYNSRLDNLQAALLNVKIKELPYWIKKRQKFADTYNLILQDNPNLVIPTKQEGRIYQDYIILAEKRDELHTFLKEQGIETLKDDYTFPPYVVIPENTAKLGKMGLRLPIAPELTFKQIQYVVESIEQFYGRSN